jgi:DNA mismatch repair protein MutS2
VEVLGYLDLVFAKAKCARTFNGSIPLLNDQGCWQLRKARHPLLDSRSAVPIDLLLAEGQSTLIITGANTGGKTVALKTLGLLTLMVQCGIPIPADEGSEAAVFNKIFADIGDEQSLQDNLSTFSAWVQTASRIIKETTGSSLVLMDEVGGGTDPNEGAALTMALIDELRNRGAKTVVTTHLNLIKAYGAIHPDVVNVSVEFNPDTLRPTYRLIYGLPGESYALPMAEKWGFDHGLIERASAYLGEGDRKVGKLLQSLERTQQEIEAKRQETERLQREAEASRKEAEALLFRARREGESLLAQSREEARASVQRAKDNLTEMINEFTAKGRTDIHRLSQAIGAEEEKINCLAWGGPQEDLAVGRKQKGRPNLGFAENLKTLGQLGEALAPNSGQRKKTIQSARPALIQYQIPAAAREIKVIGLRVEEALPLVDKAIDEAFLGGLKEIDVIHGAGTGKLRTAIREYLRDHACVKQFLPGIPGRGGDGVTVVEIGPASRAVSSGRRLRKNGLEQG